MSLRVVLWSALGVILILAATGAAWLLSLPSASLAAMQPAIDAKEAEATLAALKPQRRERPLIAIVGINDGTETTDYLMPYGILRRAGVADVVALATQPGPMKLHPALQVEPDATTAAFDGEHPEGADYVIVPAMMRDDDPEVMEWLRSQSAKGAMVVGVCAGAKVVGASGLLDGRHATTHWYSLSEL
ncbi:MAG: transcriptional regulator, partial [Mesorhizobium sp.]